MAGLWVSSRCCEEPSIDRAQRNLGPETENGVSGHVASSRFAGIKVRGGTSAGLFEMLMAWHYGPHSARQPLCLHSCAVHPVS